MATTRNDMFSAYFVNICNRLLGAYHADFYLLLTRCSSKPNPWNGISSGPATMHLWAWQGCLLSDFELSPLWKESTV